MKPNNRIESNAYEAALRADLQRASIGTMCGIFKLLMDQDQHLRAIRP